MGRQCAFFGPGWGRTNDVQERFSRGNSAQASGFPFAQIVLYPPFARLAKKSPWFPRRARHHRNVGEFIVRILGPISSTQGLHQPYYFAPLFESDLHQRQINQMGQQRVCGDEKVRSRYENTKCALSEIVKELTQCPYLSLTQHREPRQRTPFTAVE